MVSLGPRIGAGTVAALGLAIALLPGACVGVSAPHDAPLPSSTPIAAITFDALFVVNGGDNSLSVINTETNEVTGTIVLSGVSFPHHVYLSADRARLLVAVPGIDLSQSHATAHGGGAEGGAGGAVLLLDATTGATVVSRRLPASNHNAVVAPIGGEVWTAQLGSPGSVDLLDPTTLESKQSITVGIQPSEVTFTSDGKRAFVANTGSSSVTVVDALARRVVATIPVGADPVGAWQGNNGIAYVDNEVDGTVSALDTSTLKVLFVYQLGFVPGVVALAPDGTVWVANPYGSKVSVRAGREDKELGTIAAGQGAHAIAFTGRGDTAYVTNQWENTVSVVDVRSRRTVKTIAVGGKPNGLAWRAK